MEVKHCPLHILLFTPGMGTMLRLIIQKSILLPHIHHQEFMKTFFLMGGLQHYQKQFFCQMEHLRVMLALTKQTNQSCGA